MATITSNTPKQLVVFDALAATPPRYAHLPLLHGPDGKSFQSAMGPPGQVARDRRSPAAARNYLALLGWGADDDETILSTDELVENST